MTSDTTKPITTTQPADSRTCRRLIVCQRVRPVTSAPLMARMAPPSGAMTIAPMIDADGVLEQAERRHEGRQRQQDDVGPEGSAERLALGEQVVEVGRAQRHPGIDQGGRRGARSGHRGRPPCGSREIPCG